VRHSQIILAAGAVLNNFYFCVKMMVGLSADGFLCEYDGRASHRWLFCVKMMVGLRADGFFM
jgi:hypothetical protein